MNIKSFISSSIGKKQIVATTGLMLSLFLVGHLAGNLFIYVGPEAFNKYAEKLMHLRPGLLVVEFGLLGIFLIHIYFTALVVMENRKARGDAYEVYRPVGQRSLATKLMPYTGSILLAFVIYHLIDFTFADKHGALSILSDGKSYGLYGVVYNAFSNFWHSLFYIIAMASLGLHLNHGVQSFIQTYGWADSKHANWVQNLSHVFSLFIVFGFSAIPIYIYFHNINSIGH